MTTYNNNKAHTDCKVCVSFFCCSVGNS